MRTQLQRGGQPPHTLFPPSWSYGAPRLTRLCGTVLSISNLMAATARILNVSVQAGSEGVWLGQSLWAPAPEREQGVGCKQPAPAPKHSQAFQAHLLPGLCCASVLRPCTPGHAGACVLKRVRGEPVGRMPMSTTLAGLVASWPHSLIVLGGCQSAGHTICFDWATDEVLLSGR